MNEAEHSWAETRSNSRAGIWSVLGSWHIGLSPLKNLPGGSNTKPAVCCTMQGGGKSSLWSRWRPGRPSLENVQQTNWFGGRQGGFQMSEAYLTLLEGHKFRLFVYGEVGGDAFVALFRHCWEQIPEGARRDLLEYWGKSGFEHLPSFELSDLWHDSAIAHAQVKGPGYEMRFNAATFLELPVPVALFIIAHELGHVYQWARGMKQVGESQNVSEGVADGIAVMWGFDNKARDSFKRTFNRCGFKEACRIHGSRKAAKPDAAASRPRE
jgi:hypothetical protein